MRKITPGIFSVALFFNGASVSHGDNPEKHVHQTLEESILDRGGTI